MIDRHGLSKSPLTPLFPKRGIPPFCKERKEGQPGSETIILENIPGGNTKLATSELLKSRLTDPCGPFPLF